MPTSDPYLTQCLDKLHDSPMQAKLRRIRPWPVGCVFIQHPQMTLEDIRRHFRLMRELGFTALKQCQVCPGTDQKQVMHLALEEGIIPWWYGEAGWENPSPELLRQLGIDSATPIENLRTHPVWLERQKRIMHDRIDGHATALDEAEDSLYAKLFQGPAPRVPGVPLSFDFELTPAHVPLFVTWLQKTYGSIAQLNQAWNVHHCMIAGARQPVAGETTGETSGGNGWSSWEHLRAELPEIINQEHREYRRIRDVLRFKADIYLQHVEASAVGVRRLDAHAPFRAGGEMGLFLPFAARATDMEGIARLMAEHGSFYPSIHLAWHFEEVEYETVRPLYMQSSIAADWFKGGWSATWESTGGPQQMTGNPHPFWPGVERNTPGFTVDAGVMTQLMLSWIAGGFRGFGLWCWSVRTAGWEAGEFGLLDRNNRPTERARTAGKIGQACRRWRDELWQARKEPIVGVFQDWENEAIWAASARAARDHFKYQPIRARIGVSRALINANIPWEHVTADNLRRGLADRYRVIYLPAVLAVAPEMLDILHGYVARGGRVVLDAPGAWFDDFGRLLSTDDGSRFEKLFGTRIADYQYSRQGNRPWLLDDHLVTGCTLDLQPTTAKVVGRFDHGLPAVTENRVGQGAAVVLGYEAALMCVAPGHVWAEEYLRRHTLGGLRADYACDGAIVYRLAAPGADHYFLLNDGPACSAKLDVSAYRYTGASDVLTEAPVDLAQRVDLPAHSGRWVRCAKPRGA